MDTTNLYFFSTIPQVIAAIIALLGAFHMFRNQGTRESLFGFAYNVYKSGNQPNAELGGIEELRLAIRTRKLNEHELGFDKKPLPSFKEQGFILFCGHKIQLFLTCGHKF